MSVRSVKDRLWETEDSFAQVNRDFTSPDEILDQVELGFDLEESLLESGYIKFGPSFLLSVTQRIKLEKISSACDRALESLEELQFPLEAREVALTQFSVRASKVVPFLTRMVKEDKNALMVRLKNVADANFSEYDPDERCHTIFLFNISYEQLNSAMKQNDFFAEAVLKALCASNGIVLDASLNLVAFLSESASIAPLLHRIQTKGVYFMLPNEAVVFPQKNIRQLLEEAEKIQKVAQEALPNIGLVARSQILQAFFTKKLQKRVLPEAVSLLNDIFPVVFWRKKVLEDDFEWTLTARGKQTDIKAIPLTLIPLGIPVEMNTVENSMHYEAILRNFYPTLKVHLYSYLSNETGWFSKVHAIYATQGVAHTQQEQEALLVSYCNFCLRCAMLIADYAV